ncbi:MAG: hypothetical protein IIY49_02785 [Eubacterium sp.]|nr:hypothetical protein [Eubacterium sp.]
MKKHKRLDKMDINYFIKRATKITFILSILLFVFIITGIVIFIIPELMIVAVFVAFLMTYIITNIGGVEINPFIIYFITSFALEFLLFIIVISSLGEPDDGFIPNIAPFIFGTPIVGLILSQIAVFIIAIYNIINKKIKNRETGPHSNKVEQA